MGVWKTLLVCGRKQWLLRHWWQEAKNGTTELWRHQIFFARQGLQGTKECTGLGFSCGKQACMLTDITPLETRRSNHQINLVVVADSGPHPKPL